MVRPRGPTNKKDPGALLRQEEHRDRESETVDYNFLDPHCNLNPSEIQTKQKLRGLLAQFDNPAQPIPPLPPAPAGTGEVGKLIDQCLARISHHQEIIYIHQAEVDKHRQILRQLERLIPVRRAR